MPFRPTTSRLEPYLSARDMPALWAYLHRDLARFGFEKVFYVCTQRRPACGEFTVRDAAIQSSYGTEFDRFFVSGGAFLADVTTQWAINSEGAVSWGLSRRLNARGQLTAKQREVHERSLALGIVNGYTVSLRSPRAALISGFGLCAEEASTQGRVDRTWQAHGDEVLMALSAFDVCARAMPRVPPEEELSPRQREVLEWAGDGKTIEEIAEIMGLHRNTVTKHMQEARERLGVANTLQAVLRAVIQGQIYR
ncbi:helix-turn-helix transcriptional regulator [Rhodovulum marinum]|uniref:DNA-binding CsgD family transcriptional regulator n=1 Tax=Rhodovulum marinum TaxID=320662 RepID=A0A4R2PWQ5_9RHOB|nr:LuxR family transcriptional regulator [Rhodovulum marinum]TCP39608.1 DNA-binding CsgD family transcriptional regulator [Rhodovulum marinum]